MSKGRGARAIFWLDCFLSESSAFVPSRFDGKAMTPPVDSIKAARAGRRRFLASDSKWRPLNTRVPHLRVATDDLAHASSGLAADTFTPASPSARGPAARSHLGPRIANSKGVPGTLGCFARSLLDRRMVVLSSWHILFGEGAPGDSEVWMVDESGGSRRYSNVGRTLYGKIGQVRLDDKDFHVDCAISSWLYPPGRESPPSPGGIETRFTHVAGHDIARPGDLVTKKGAATGLTLGIVSDVDYCDRAWIGGRPYPATRQLLVRSSNPEAVFCAEGDSGSIIVNALGKAVGLLWGANGRGEGVACPIAAVLSALNITLELSPPGSK